QQLEAARGAFNEALADEVEQMHAAADQVFWGAVVQGSLGVVAGAASVSGALSSNAAISKAIESGCDQALSVALKTTTAEALGQALNAVAVPVGKLVSGSDGEHSRAEAKEASGRGEQAKWQMDDAKERVDQSKQTADRTTQWASSLVDKHDSTISALIQDFA
ncbi:MAG TPA: hypothetical protein VEQ59_06965, partial [Polyangiaceae bacterium]|nr:hypothetical protein [Polyangiaceae bacterium]